MGVQVGSEYMREKVSQRLQPLFFSDVALCGGLPLVLRLRIDFAGAMLASGLAWQTNVLNVNGSNRFRLAVVSSSLRVGVPEPGTFLLLALGLALVAPWRSVVRCDPSSACSERN